MSRLQMVPAEPQDPALRAMFDEVRSRGIPLPNPYRVIGHAPPMLRAWLDFAWPLRLHAKTPRRLRELLILRGAQVSGAGYEWVHHVTMALAAGVTQAQIDALAGWEHATLFSAQEKAVLRLADEVTRGPGASDACIDALRRHGFGDAEIVELTLTASFYVCVSRFLQSMDVELEEGLDHD
ncbi:MAG: carboxymuconolactone decarboxylase family protein [Betaproteobacteria bacterium]|nr:carboxymuconolactone decarboxylase family protein [Betaproteobacteria bacterium]